MVISTSFIQKTRKRGKNKGQTTFRFTQSSFVTGQVREAPLFILIFLLNYRVNGESRPAITFYA
jgi:hypothetical protein